MSFSEDNPYPSGQPTSTQGWADQSRLHHEYSQARVSHLASMSDAEYAKYNQARLAAKQQAAKDTARYIAQHGEEYAVSDEEHNPEEEQLPAGYDRDWFESDRELVVQSRQPRTHYEWQELDDARRRIELYRKLRK